jgi:UDP-N-acetylmuramoyl-tripeptide--D-alanyl-D-alanine ligase
LGLIWVKTIEALLSALITAMSCKYFLHLFQQEHYQQQGYGAWLAKHREKYLAKTLTVGAGVAIVYYLLRLLLTAINMGDSWAAELVCGIVVVIGYFFTGLFTTRSFYSEPIKKPIVYTARMRRLVGTLTAICAMFSVLLTLAGIAPFVLFVAIPYLVIIAGYAILPVEKHIYNTLIGEAKAILAGREDLIRIGITGSFGKTSVKYLLNDMLSEKYNVLMTPGSQNVPMSVTRLIRENLEPQHEIFLAEMGTRNFGDIRELVDLVRPQYGVLTSVGEQHLERFGSVENVAKAKYELVEGLPRNGAAFFLADNAWCDALYDKTVIEKHRAGLTEGEMFAKDIVSGPFGSRFRLCRADGESIACEMKLLGRHNVQNAVLAASVAYRFGVTLAEIARGLKKAQPVEHRLQLIATPGGMTIIDDAFNSNPIGAQNALEVLAGFSGRRIIVTPGMVEQGELEDELNRAFGRALTGKCDVAILVGKRHVQPIAQGALETGFDKEALHIVPNLDEAQKLLAAIGRTTDVVLFENDLADNYSE